MTTVNKYRVWCNVDSKYEYVWAETEPTTCPVLGHEIDTDVTTIVDSVGQESEYTDSGALLTSKTHSSYNEDTKFKGMLVQASGVDTDTMYDHLITTELYMAGGQYWSDGGVAGDYAECSVIDKDDVLGLFSMYGLVSGVDILELKKFAETIYLKPGGAETTTFDTDDVSFVAAGLYLRTKVHTTSEEPIDMGVYYRWFEV